MSDGKEQPCGAGIGSLSSAEAQGYKVGESGEASGPVRQKHVAESSGDMW